MLCEFSPAEKAWTVHPFIYVPWMIFQAFSLLPSLIASFSWSRCLLHFYVFWIWGGLSIRVLRLKCSGRCRSGTFAILQKFLTQALLRPHCDCLRGYCRLNVALLLLWQGKKLRFPIYHLRPKCQWHSQCLECTRGRSTGAKDGFGSTSPGFWHTCAWHSSKKWYIQKEPSKLTFKKF